MTDIVERLRDNTYDGLQHEAADEIERLREENRLLLEKRESCINIEGAPHGFCRDASHSSGRYVCECEGWAEQEIERLRKERDELKTWLEDQVCEAKDFAYKLEGKTVELATVTKDRNELVAICKSVVESGISFVDIKAMCDVIANLGADKMGEK